MAKPPRMPKLPGGRAGRRQRRDGTGLPARAQPPAARAAAAAAAANAPPTERDAEPRPRPSPRPNPRAASGTGGSGAGAGRDRRALTSTRSAGRMQYGGSPAFAGALADALRAATGEDRVAESLTHPLHTYAARMHPATARHLIEIVGESAGGNPLLDPFCGSGTTLVEAAAAGRAAIGVDLNPLAAMIARAKTWRGRADRRRILRDTAHHIAGEAIAAGKLARRAGEPEATTTKLRSPKGFDPNARNRRLQHWFSPHVRRELEQLAAAIDVIRAVDTEQADLLFVVLSSILYKVSKRTSDTDPTPVQKTVARGAAARLFAERADLLAIGIADLAAAAREHGAAAPGAVVVHEGDARALAALGIAPASIAGVVTSPPYVGTYDYAEQHRLRFDFLGVHHRAFEAGELGSRRAFDGGAEAQQRALQTWQRDLTTVMSGLATAMRPGARAAFVVGDSIAANQPIAADNDLRASAGAHFEITAWAWQERPKLNAFERRVYGSDAKREHILLLTRR